MIHIKKPLIVQIGTWIVDNFFEFVWFNDQNEPHFYRLEKDLNQNLQSMLKHQIQVSFSKRPKSIKLKLVTVLLPHQIWSHRLLFEHLLSAEECRQQCQYILQKELPFALEEVWFDHMVTPLQQGMRMDIFAVRIEIAKRHLAQFAPFKIDVLDALPNCLSKALNYLSSDYSLQSCLLLYQDEQQNIALHNHTSEWQIVSKNSQNLTEVYRQFNQHYAKQITNILIYQKNQISTEFEQPHQIIKTEFPLISLGAALWKKDLHQYEKLD